MQCACGHINPDGSKFCNNCGMPLATEPVKGEVLYGIFTPGGYGDGFKTSFQMVSNLIDVMRQQNDPNSTALKRKDEKFFLGKVTKVDLLPDDVGSGITERYSVLRWWQLEWDETQWVISEEVGIDLRPESLGLSPLEGS